MGHPDPHDYNIYSYAVDCRGQRITLHAEYYPYGSSTDLLDVTFTGVVAHHFECVLAGNVIFDVEDVEPGRIVQECSDLFAAQRDHGWPDIRAQYTSAEELVAILQQRGIRGFVIHSSYGLHGWVLAAAMGIHRRPTRGTSSS